MTKTAKEFMKSGLRQTGYNNDQWDTFLQEQKSSLWFSGSQKREININHNNSAELLEVDGNLPRIEEVPLKRFRSTKESRKLRKMTSKVYRSALSEANVSSRLAVQIRLMREQAGLSQAELAAALRTRQSAVARMEDLNYGKHSIAMLHKLARFFDVATWVEFISFSTFIRRTHNLTPVALTPSEYDREFDAEGDPLPHLTLYRDDNSPLSSSNYFEVYAAESKTNRNFEPKLISS